MSAIYWALTCLDLLNAKDKLPSKEILQFVLKCQTEDGGFSGNVGHDSHLLYTLSAVQILALLDALDQIDKHKVASCNTRPPIS
jgi:geranylgeranyl transferase type-2 subunit beta